MATIGGSYRKSIQPFSQFSRGIVLNHGFIVCLQSAHPGSMQWNHFLQGGDAVQNYSGRESFTVKIFVLTYIRKTSQPYRVDKPCWSFCSSGNYGVLNKTVYWILGRCCKLSWNKHWYGIRFHSCSQAAWLYTVF